MKKIVLIAMMVFTVIAYSQKKKNGAIYKEHPAIKVVESMMEAFVAGDTAKVASYLDENFRVFNGNSTNKDDKGGTKQNFINRVQFWKNNVDYLSYPRSKGAYPDAIQYADDNNKEVIWVQTWNHLKGVHKKTGVKIDMPVHDLYVVNKDNKIITAIDYHNQRPYDEIGRSFVERKNGTIYNHHEYINKVRRMIHAFENNDDETAYGFYDKKARFRNINMPIGTSQTLEESKASDKKFKEQFTINSIDVRGYPDYLNYGLGNAKVVQSWWNVRLTKKADKKGKEIVVPIMFIHTFNDDGKIVDEMAYYSDNLLK
jgi:hypothetical protein